MESSRSALISKGPDLRTWTRCRQPVWGPRRDDCHIPGTSPRHATAPCPVTRTAQQLKRPCVYQRAERTSLAAEITLLPQRAQPAEEAIAAFRGGEQERRKGCSALAAGTETAHTQENAVDDNSQLRWWKSQLDGEQLLFLKLALAKPRGLQLCQRGEGGSLLLTEPGRHSSAVRAATAAALHPEQHLKIFFTMRLVKRWEQVAQRGWISLEISKTPPAVVPSNPLQLALL